MTVVTIALVVLGLCAGEVEGAETLTILTVLLSPRAPSAKPPPSARAH